jgi:hypothetical protein
VSKAARELVLHENSVRYLLRGIAHLTGRAPRNITDLIELVAASRVIATTPSSPPRQSPRGSLKKRAENETALVSH